MERLKAVVIGIGHLGKEHARIYAGHEGIELVGLVDVDLERAQKFASKYDTKAYRSLEEVPTPIHLASVAVPTIEHFNVAKTLLEKKAHILVEKPIAQTLEQASSLVQMAKDAGLLLQVGHVERYNPAFKALQTMLVSPRFIECHRLSPFPERGTDVGVVLDLMIHDIDVVLHLTRSSVKEIRAVGVPVLSPYEDIANARLEFENGCIANLTTSRISLERMRKIRVFESDSYISLDYLEQSGKIYHKENGKIIWSHIPLEKGEPLKIEIDSFIECVRQTQNPIVSGEQGKQALEVAMEVLKVIKKT